MEPVQARILDLCKVVHVGRMITRSDIVRARSIGMSRVLIAACEVESLCVTPTVILLIP